MTRVNKTAITQQNRFTFRALRRLQKSKFGSAYVSTFFTEISILFSTILTLRMAASLLGEVGFGEYSVSKRAINLLVFPLLMGLGIGIPRYVALNKTKIAGFRPQIYLIAGLALSLPILSLFLFFVLVWPERFTWLFFGNSDLSNFAMPIALSIVGLHLQTQVYSYVRGLMQMHQANLIRAATTVIIPPLAILLSSSSAAMSIGLAGVAWIVVSVIAILIILYNSRYSIVTESASIQTAAKELLYYGLPRIPGEFALFGLFSLPTLIISHKISITDAGYFSFSLSLLQLVGALFSAAGIVLLPYISEMLGDNSLHKIRSFVAKIHISAVVVSLTATFILQWSLRYLIPLLMGTEFTVDIEQTRWLLWGIVPYVSYIILRNPLDAVTEKPYNSFNLTISIIILVILLLYCTQIFSPQQATLFALILLSVLTVYSWQKAMKNATKERPL